MRLFRRFPVHPLAESARPPGYALLLAALHGQCVRLDILGDHRTRADNCSVTDCYRCDQRGVGADERAGSDYRPILAEPVVIAGDRAGADVRARPDLGIADVRQMIDLSALADL